MKENNYVINCMKFLSKWKNCFTWPAKGNRFTYLKNEILCEIEPSIPSSNYRDKYWPWEESYKKAWESLIYRLAICNQLYFICWNICTSFSGNFISKWILLPKFQNLLSTTACFSYKVHRPTTIFFFYQNNSHVATNKFTIR